MDPDRAFEDARPMTRFGVPLVEWRRRRTLLVLVAFACGLAVAAPVLPHPLPRAIALPAVICNFLCFLYIWVSAHRQKRSVAAPDYLVCFNCGYSLIGLPGSHVCPECGRPYDQESLCRGWRKWHQRGSARLACLIALLTSVTARACLLIMHVQHRQRVYNPATWTRPSLVQELLGDDK